MHKPNLVRRPAQGEHRGHETGRGACRVACGCPLSQKCPRSQAAGTRARLCGWWGHSRPVQALRALVLVQAVVAATKVSLKGRPEEHRAVTRAASLCWQMKMSKKQKEEHMQAALRPATERFVGYSPAMQKMISSQLAQVQPVGDARWPGVCGRASGSLGRHVCTTDAYHVSLWQASKPVWEWGYQPTNGSP